MTDRTAPGWRHPGLLLAYSIVATVVAYLASGVLVFVAKGHRDWFAVGIACAIAAWFLLVFVLFRRFVEGEPAREVAPRPAVPELLVGIVGGVVLFSVVIGVIWALGGYRVVGQNPAGVMVPVLAIAILSGVTEEVVFRGFLFRLTEKWLGTWAALGISAALFGALHLGNQHATLLAGIAIMVEAGIMLAALYLLTRRLWMAIGLHAAWNFAQGGIYGVAVSGGSMAGILKPVIQGPTLLTGGAFGAEASLPAILILTAFGCALLWVAHRRGQFMPPVWRR